jgi:hypothetical protein
MMTPHQILQCEGGHTWEREGGRGRPPSHCPEYPRCKVDAETLTEIREQTVIGQIHQGLVETEERMTEILIDEGIGSDEAADEAEQEIVSLVATEADPKENPFIKRHQIRERVQKMNEGRAEKSAKQVEEERQQLAKELEELPAKIKAATDAYMDALGATKKAQTIDEIIASFNKADNLQGRLLNYLARQRKVESLLDQQQ